MAVRIVALTADPSLSVAMTMIPDWDIHETDNVFTAARLADESHAVIIGLGGTAAGEAAALDLREQGVTAPILIVGDRAAEASLIDVPVLLPPFSVEDILDATMSAMDVSAQDEPDDPSDGTIMQLDIPEPEQVEVSEPPPPPPPPPSPPPPPEPQPPPAPEVPRPQEPPPRPPAQPQTPRSRSEARAERKARPPSEPQPVKAAEQPARRKFRRTPESAKVQREEATIDDLIQAALRGMGDVNALLDRMPIFGDRAALADVFVSEVVEQVAPESVAILVRSVDLLTVASHHGLTPAERAMKVPLDQPLVLQLSTSHESVFIAPVDLARGLLTGLPGARSEALLASPIFHGGQLLGLIVVGGAGFDERGLSVLDNLAREAASGLAVAVAIETLRTR